jgi:glycosyltransferase involved in cell wall biosynthesis
MKVSVIVPCYNFAKYIEQAIFSAVAQKTNFEFEVLVSDDFSTDSSLSVIQRLVVRYSSIVKSYTPTENLGFFENIKFLFKEAKGEYIALLDGDDYWTDLSKLQKQIDFMEINKEYVLTFTGYQILHENGTYTPPDSYQWMGLPTHKNEDLTTEDLLENNWVTFGRVYKNNVGSQL